MRRRKEWVSVRQQLMDQKHKMSEDEELGLLYKEKGLIDNILSDLKEEKRILEEDIASWERDVEKHDDKIRKVLSPDFFDSSSGEECESEDSPDESENSPQCALCLAQNAEEENSEEENPEEEDSSRYDSSE